jgi:hypothetical protein
MFKNPQPADSEIMNYHRWTRVAMSSSGLGFLLFVAISMTPSWSQSGNWSDQASPVTQHPMNGAIAPAQVATAGNSMMASVILANGFQQIVVVDHGKTADCFVDDFTGYTRVSSFLHSRSISSLLDGRWLDEAKR